MESSHKHIVEFGHDDDPRIRTGVEKWREFILSGPWSDIKLFLEDRAIVVRLDMETVLTMPEMFRLQQELKDIEFFLALPSFLSAQRVQQNEEDHETDQEELL